MIIEISMSQTLIKQRALAGLTYRAAEDELALDRMGLAEGVATPASDARAAASNQPLPSAAELRAWEQANSRLFDPDIRAAPAGSTTCHDLVPLFTHAMHS